jgi:hypothetical protein
MWNAFCLSVTNLSNVISSGKPADVMYFIMIHTAGPFNEREKRVGHGFASLQDLHLA